MNDGPIDDNRSVDLPGGASPGDGDRVIETERLRLRPHRAEDLACSLAIWTDPAALRFLGGRPLTEEEVWLRLLRYAGSWALAGYGFWRVEDRVTGASVGEVGFQELKRAIEPSFSGVPEVGWIIRTALQGRGLAAEAVGAALAWGDRHIAHERRVAIIHPDNVASVRVARAQGFQAGVETVYKGAPVVIFDRPRRFG